MSAARAKPLLAVRGLGVAYGDVVAVRGATFELAVGEVVALVGESGAGKSAAARAVMGLVGFEGGTVTGSVRLEGEELVGADPERLRALRGRRMALVPQSLAALDPLWRVGDSVAEAIAPGGPARDAAAREAALDALARAGFDDPEPIAHARPHELSGGMRQRALIAAATIARPRLLIADEPTSALDTTVAAHVLDLLDELRGELGGVLLITHDMGAVARLADRVVVMQDGRVVERGRCDALLAAPTHAYTRRLIDAVRELAR